MTPSCPKCESQALTRDRTLRPPVFTCGHCKGLWLLPGEADILKAETSSTTSTLPPRVPNDKKGGFCPFGHGLLARARVELDDGGEDFYLERCQTCSGVFFDDGEWARLLRSPMLEHLDDLWDPRFQQKLAEERSRERWRDDMVQKLSQETVDVLDALAAQLYDRGLASEAIAYLSERVREHNEAALVGPRRTRKVDSVLLHVVPAHERLDQYTPASLASEGFVHLCERDQLTGVILRHFSESTADDKRVRTGDLNVLVLDPARLLHPIKDDPVGDHGVFPHLYGPLRPDAVKKVVAVPKEMGLDEVLRRVDDAIEGGS